MTEVEQGLASHNYERTEIVTALLDFMELTSISAQSLASPVTLFEGAGRFAHRDLEYWNEINLGIMCIKNCVQSLEGIEVDFIDPYDGEHMKGRITDIKSISDDPTKWELLFRNDTKYRFGVHVPLTPKQLREAVNVETV